MRTKKFKEMSEEQKSFQKEMESTSRKLRNLNDKIKVLEEEKQLEIIINNLQDNKYAEKLDSINNSLQGLDINFIKQLNKKIDKLLYAKKIGNIITISVLSIILLISIGCFVFKCKYSPVFQKTRQQTLLNDILEEHFDELCAEDDAIKAVEQCKTILEEWNKKKEQENKASPNG